MKIVEPLLEKKVMQEVLLEIQTLQHILLPPLGMIT